MCMASLVEYQCGHAERHYYNQHCSCALLVGPAIQVNAVCGKRCAMRNLKDVRIPTTEKTGQAWQASQGLGEIDRQGESIRGPAVTASLFAALWPDRTRTLEMRDNQRNLDNCKR